MPASSRSTRSLDIMLPGIDGYRICATLRDEGNWTLILMLTAKDGEWDEVEALDTGADDYLTKPRANPELSGTPPIRKGGKRRGASKLRRHRRQSDPAQPTN